jgi:hypothetical protein
MGKRADREEKKCSTTFVLPAIRNLGSFKVFKGGGLNITANSVSKIYFSLHFDANGFFLSKSLKVF